MASVYRKTSPAGKKLPSWYCKFRIPAADGQLKQVHRCTGKRLKGEALDAARLLEKESLSEAGAGDQKSEAILSKVKEAAELAMKGRLNPAHARRIIGNIVELGGGENLSHYTMRGWVEDWVKEKEASTKPTTAQFYRATTNMFLKHLGKRADLLLEAITTRDVRGFRDAVRDSGRAAKTCNHKLKCLRSVFGDAVKVAAILHNPASPIKALDENDSVPRLPFDLKEVRKLIKAAPSDDWKGVILVGTFTGLRLLDAARLKAGNIDLKRGAITLTPMKTDRKKTVVEIPMHPDLLAFFKANPPSPFAAAPVFESLHETSSGGREGLSAQFKDIMEAAKVDRHLTRKTSDGAARDTAMRSFHSLRHTFTTWLAKADVTEELRMKMTGHTESRTHQKYTHQELSTLQDAVDKIPGLG